MFREKYLTPDRTVLAGVLLAALAYLQDLRYDFILDDVPLIMMNERLASWRNWKSLFVTDLFEIKHPTSAMELGGLVYRPIYRLWQLCIEQMFGLVLPWWHLSSLLLHVAVTLLVYRLGIQLLKDRWTAALAAALFAVHPIHAESVAYATASTDLLVTFFCLLSFLAYARFREGGSSPAYLALSVIGAALAMLSKETAVMYPLMLVAYEALREPREGERQTWARFAWTLPFFAVIGGYFLVRSALFGLSSGPGPGGGRVAGLFYYVPLVTIAYLRNLVWPFRLSFFYPAEWGAQWTVVRALAVGATGAAAVALWRAYRNRSDVRLLLIWAAILPVPALMAVYTFVRENWVHDRHMYFVSVPVCLVIATLLTDARWPAKYRAGLSAAIVVILFVALAMQMPRFSDDAAIYASSIQVAPRSFLAHSYYGEALWGYGRFSEGLNEFQFVTELSPHSAKGHERYGAALAQLGRATEAKQEFQSALQWSPDATPFRATILFELAELEMKRSEIAEATGHLREAVQIAPNTLNYHALLAQALKDTGHAEEADLQMDVEATLRRRASQEARTIQN